MRKPLVILIAVALVAALSSAAEAKWTANGTPVCTAAGNQVKPVSCTDGAGGSIIAWEDSRLAGYDIYIQRVDAFGNSVWTNQGVAVATGIGQQQGIDIVSDGAGGAFLTWSDTRSIVGRDVYVQHVDATGTPQWTTNGVLILETTQIAHPVPKIARDGSGGIFVTYSAPTTFGFDIFAQHVDANGDTLWAANGMVICDATNHQYDPEIVADGSGGAVIMWEDLRAGGNREVYAQRINAVGLIQWSSNGAWVSDLTGSVNERGMVITTDGAGGAIAVWREQQTHDDLRAQRIDSGGFLMWGTGVVVSNATRHQRPARIVSDGVGGAVIAWQDERAGGLPVSDIYAQWLDSLGIPQWTANGVAVCTATGIQEEPDLIHDNGITTIAWSDDRLGSDPDIYAQRLDSGGNALRAAGGEPICNEPGDQGQVTIVSSAARLAIVGWSDQRGSDFDIYAAEMAPPACSVSPLTLEFRNTNIGDYKDLDFTITNTGGDTLTGSVAQQPCADFSVVSGLGSYALEHEDTVVVTVRFAPQSHDTVSCFVYTGCDSVLCNAAGGSLPLITAADDVPYDQGGFVYITWDPPIHDTPPNRLITHYSVWRSLTDQMLAARLLAGIGSAPVTPGSAGPMSGGPVIRTTVSAGVTYYWEWLVDIPAHYLPGYMYTAPTLYDSTASDPAYHAFMVSSQTADPFVFWDSDPMTGYSVDNLSPAQPQALAGEQNYTPEGLQLTWEPNVEGDLGGYKIYRGTSSDFVPGPGNLVASPAQETWFDDQWRWNTGSWYKVSAVDVHDNESGFAVTGPDDVTGAGTPGVPDAFALGQNVPNPFNPTTTILYDVSAGGGAVTLQIFDVSGRLVRTLVDGHQSPGSKSVVWNGTNDRGQGVASGIYFYRMTAPQFSSTRKMVLLQ